MKKVIFTLAFLVQTIFVFAAGPEQIAQASYENVKMYRQAGTSTDILKALKSTDEIVVIRKHNANWTIVTVNGEAGYVLTSELIMKKDVKNIAMTKTGRKTSF
jgi:uncharacterized protein YgiM (DUF1202 family)